MPGPASAGDDAQLPLVEDTPLIRAFHPRFTALDLDRQVRPASRAFNDIKDEQTGTVAMSVYRADLLIRDDIPLDAIVEAHPDFLIVSVPTKSYWDLQLEVVPAPEAGRVGHAHMHVLGGLTKGRKNRLVAAVVQGPGGWVKGPP